MVIGVLAVQGAFIEHEKVLDALGVSHFEILLADRLSNDESRYFGTLPVTVRRNAYGRQLGSFHAREKLSGIGEIPMTFIRAPYVEEAHGAEVLASVDDNIVAVRYRNQLATAFHPELDEDLSVHKYFFKICEKSVNC